MNANANCLLNTRAGGYDSVLISVAVTSSRINFVGASCPASVEPITHGLTSVTLAPQKGKKGVVAIQVWHQPFGESHANRDLCYLLTTTYDSQPFVELAIPFIPPADHLAQLMDSGLLVTVDGQKFVAPNFCHDKAEGLSEMKALWAEQKIKIVNDANLLCRFLAGDATIEKILAAAKVSQAAAGLPAKYAALDSLNAKLEKAIEKLEARRYTATSSARTIFSQAMELLKMTENIVGIAQAAKFGDRKESLERITGYKENAQVFRLQLVSFKNTLSPEKDDR